MPTFPDVRRARREEQERVGALWLAFLEDQASMDPRLDVAEDALERWRNDFPVWLDDETRRIYVAVSGKETDQEESIQGFAMAHRSAPPPIYAAVDEVYLDELYVVPEQRRKGFGTQLVHAVRHWAETVSANRIRLQIMTANEGGQAFWRQVGAQPFSTSMTLEVSAVEADSSGKPQIGF